MYFFESLDKDKRVVLIMGKDKYENDLLLKYFFKDMNCIWFHVQNYSSSHVYVKLDEPIKSDVNILDYISPQHLADATQLCKANSIAGNKLQKVEIVSTPYINLKKSGGMDPGQVSFKSTRFVKSYACFARDNQILSRLEKTKVVLDNEPSVDEAFVIDNMEGFNDDEIISKIFKIENSDKVLPNVEEFLRKLKKGKQGNSLVDFVQHHRERLILVERLRKQLKKKPKTQLQNKKKITVIDGIDYSDFY